MTEGPAIHPIRFIATLLGIAILALALRLPHLSNRPMHTDEAVHAAKLGELLDRGVYTYDPHEYHGPTLYDFTLPILYLKNIRSYAEIPDESTLRFAPVLFGLMIVLLPALLGNILPRRAILFSSLFFAISPAFAFYSRYYIQEIILAALTLLLIGSIWRWRQCTSPRRSLLWLVIAAVATGLMAATKETWFLTVGCMAFSGALTLEWARIRHEPPRPAHLHLLDALIFLTVALGVAGLLLTNFLANPSALGDMVKAYSLYVSRGISGAAVASAAAEHYHPWWYYLRLLAFYKIGPGPWWSEGIILVLAAVAIVHAFKPSLNSAAIPFLRWLSLYAILIFMLYSALPYKTPWLVLNLLLPLIFLAGSGVDALFSRLPTRTMKGVFFIFLAAACGHLCAESLRATQRFEADPRNPFVYAQTSPNFLRLIRRVDDLAAISPEHQSLTIKVIIPGSDYWPLPWYLRHYPNVGYWTAFPQDIDAPVIITTPALASTLGAEQTAQYQAEFYGIRPEVLLEVFIRRDLWEAFLKTREASAP